MDQRDREQAQRQVDQEDRAPAEAGNERSTERRAERGADRRHRSEQAHGAAGACLRNGVADEGHGQGHHDGRPETLRGAGDHQHPERGGDATRCGRHGKDADTGEHEPAAPQQIAKAAHADDQRGDREQVGQHHPLDRLK